MLFGGQVELQARLLAQLQRQADGERAAPAQLALQRDLAAQQLRQLADDRQAQAGAGVFARQRIARLAELLEHQVLFLRGDADAGVDDGETHVPRVGRRP